MKNETLKIDPVFKNFYTQKLKERCSDLKRYENIEELISIEKEIKEETWDKRILAQDMSIYISIILYVLVFILNGCIFNIFHFNLKDIMLLLLNFTCSFLLMSLLLFFIFFPLYSFCQLIININRKPKGMSFRVFYSFFHLGIERYINKIGRKIKINPDVFYNLIQEADYSQNKKNKMIKQYSKEKLGKGISLVSFSEIVARITIKYKYGHVLSNFYKPFL